MSILYINDDTMLIKHQRVKVPPFLKNKEGNNERLDASYGFKKKVRTPWDAYEVCTITAVPSLAGGYDYYAQVTQPKSNPYVRYCTFRVDI